MPYIKKEDRKRIDKGDRPETPGELNYYITKALHSYIDAAELDYQSINDCIGVLECAKLELYRRVAAAYEEIKIKENGDL